MTQGRVRANGPRMTTRTGARTGGRILVDQLKIQGCDRIFTVPGESFLAVLDALHDTPEIDLVVCRQEGGVAYMADADGKMTGRPGVRTGGRILVDQLRIQGCDRIFTVPGESFLAVLDALHDTPEIDTVVCRQEGGVAYMADADGKMTGRPGHRLRHPRAGRDQRQRRRPCRLPGFRPR